MLDFTHVLQLFSQNDIVPHLEGLKPVLAQTIDIQSQTLLHLAVMYLNPQVLCRLMTAGAPLNAVDK